MSLQQTIDECWENRANISLASAPGGVRQAVNSVIAQLDAGTLRVAEKDASGQWIVHQWVKKAVLLSFRLHDNHLVEGGFGRFYDKVATKFEGWSEAQFQEAGMRVAPPACAWCRRPSPAAAATSPAAPC